MNRVQMFLGVGALALALNGCGEKEKINPVYLEGKVVKENYKSVSAKPKYVLTVDTNEGVYTFEVMQPIFSTRGSIKTVSALEEAIEVGDKLKFKVGFNSTRTGYKSLFSKDKIGSVISNDIELMEKAKK